MNLGMKSCVLAILIIYPFFTNAQHRIEYYDSGEKSTEYDLVDNKKHGIQLAYYKSGQILARAAFKNGLQDGASTIYFENGNVQKAMQFCDGIQCDTMKIYFDGGQLAEISTIHNGKKEGSYKAFYLNGMTRMEGSLANGIAHGYFKYYDSLGVLTKKGNYENGKPVGSWMETDKYGVVYKNYKSSQAVSENESVVEFKHENFKLKYPASWTRIDHAQVVFACIPTSANGPFKENITVVAQLLPPEIKNQEELISYVNEHYKKTYDNVSIVSDEKFEVNNLAGRDVIYKIQKKNGTALFHLKIWTRYLMIGNTSYQLTFTAGDESYEKRIPDVTMIFNSFAAY
jgi:antitoxin component YwqK of YwqJK toxin-antitoxin module